MGQIKVLVVDDSWLYRELIVKNLSADSEIKVVAAVEDPYEARNAIIKYHPDVMTLDLELPRMNGVDFLRKLMPQYPIPVLVISSDADRVFDALNAGAVDFIEKPAGNDPGRIEDFFKKNLVEKVKITSLAQISPQKKEDSVSSKKNIIAIGASTGGTEAIATVLKGMKEDVPGIVIVQHMPAGFTKSFASRLNEQSKLRVKEAEDGDFVETGCAYVAPGGKSHMRVIKVDGKYRISIEQGPKVNGHCPSVDVLFESVARAAKCKALGIILTGMGGDGAKGLLEMRRAGAGTIGQDKSTCVVYGMPNVANNIGAVEYQEKLENIPNKVYSLIC